MTVHQQTPTTAKPQPRPQPDLDETYLAQVDRAVLATKQQDPFQAHRTAFVVEDQLRTSRGSHFQ